LLAYPVTIESLGTQAMKAASVVDASVGNAVANVHVPLTLIDVHAVLSTRFITRGAGANWRLGLSHADSVLITLCVERERLSRHAGTTTLAMVLLATLGR